MKKRLPLGTKCEYSCPDCGADLVLRYSSRYNSYFYGCKAFPKCLAAHGAHYETGEPLGIPANQETKNWRIKAHDAFDLLWKKDLMTKKSIMHRQKAYRWMQEAMEMTKDEAHIGNFDIEQCKRLIEKVNERLAEEQNGKKDKG